MLVIATEGLLTMVQRDSREALGDFVVRAWETHEARLKESSREPSASPHSIAAGARSRAHARRGCSYAEEPLAEEPCAEEPLAEEPLAEEPCAEESCALDFGKTRNPPGIREAESAP
jgi:hypothetical protein